MQYQAEVSYLRPEWETVSVEADSKDQAEYLIQNLIMDTNPDVVHIELDEIKELNG